jgi:glycosyltransferase involved in cell wall biosynthesis
MRIAHLVISGDVAGGQMVALELARGAVSRGDEVLFLSPTRGEFAELVEREGIRVLPVDVSRAARLAGARRLARDLRREQVDVLHTHTAIAANILSRLAGRLAGVPVVSHLHIENYLPLDRLRASALRAADNATARLAARIVAVSERTKRALIEQGYPARLIDVVPNGIHLVSHDGNLPGRTTRSALGVPDGSPVIGEIARLCDVKGQRELLRALAGLPGVHAVLAGKDLEAGGAYRRGLEREAAELGVADRVVFAGYRPAAEILPALDVFVLPSWIEGMPIVALEAMAYGKPVVATPVGGTAELVVDEETGLLVPPRDPPALAAAIRRLLDDPPLARRLGEAGRARVAEHFSAEAMTRRVLAIYDEVARR